MRRHLRTFLNEVASVLDLKVDWIGGESVVLDKELMSLRFWDWPLLDRDGAFRLGEDSGGVGHGGVIWGVSHCGILVIVV